MIRWAWRRIVEIITRHDWQLLALFLSVLALAHALANILPFAGAVVGGVEVVRALALLTLGALLFRSVLANDARHARWTLFTLSLVLGQHAYAFLLVIPAHYAAFAVVGAASLGCGVAYLAAGEG